MKQLLVIAAAVLAACTFPPMNPQKQAEIPVSEIPVSPVVEVIAPREVESPKEVKKKPKQTHPDCSAIQTGSLKDDINAKLDCIAENHA